MRERWENRIRNEAVRNKVRTPAEAAALIRDGMLVGTSGFTMAGYPKAVPQALAERAMGGEKLRIDLLTGASVGDELDGVLARAGVIRRRYPYQTNVSLRDQINAGEIQYVDMHLSQVPYWIKRGYFGRIHMAIIEAAAIDEAGNIIPTTSVGCSDALAACADQVIVELNLSQPAELEGIHDIYSPQPFPGTQPIPLVHPAQRIGTPFIPCGPEKIAAVVVTDQPDVTRSVPSASPEERAMAGHLIAFLERETAQGRLPTPLPPLQSGVGAVANAILGQLSQSGFSGLTLYSEVLQDSVLELLRAGMAEAASATSVTLSQQALEEFEANIGFYRQKITLRPEEISNSPEVIHRLGVIAVNTAIEVDLSGNVNSTHIGGTRVMNGIGGSGDFARNAGLTVFTTASTAKGGAVSCIVPSVSHIDHTEHDVQVVITEQGAADLRGLTAYERAAALIQNCAHPKFRAGLTEFLEQSWDRHPYRHGLAALYAR